MMKIKVDFNSDCRHCVIMIYTTVKQMRLITFVAPAKWLSHMRRSVCTVF